MGKDTCHLAEGNFDIQVSSREDSSILGHSLVHKDVWDKESFILTY